MILIAPDSFKGTLTAVQVASALSRGVRRAGEQVDECPVGDGGEGTMDVLLAGLRGRLVGARAHDPLGRPVEVPFAILEDGRAVVEAAAASGLALLAREELDPWNASTFGTGELIAAAAREAEEVLLCVGGTATMDGGRGALQALGEAAPRLVALCDVRTPWERCAEVFGPQKGADTAMVARLRERFHAMAAEFPRDPRGVPMTGAAGGLSGGLWAALGAELRAGAPFVLDAIGFDDRLARARSVIVGEGRLDAQSAMGKVVGEIAERARLAGVPVHAVVGSVGEDPPDLASVSTATTVEELEAAGEALARA